VPFLLEIWRLGSRLTDQEQVVLVTKFQMQTRAGHIYSPVELVTLNHSQRVNLDNQFFLTTWVYFYLSRANVAVIAVRR